MSEENDDLSVEGIAKEVLKKLGVTHYNLAQYQTQISVVTGAIKSLESRLSDTTLEAAMKLNALESRLKEAEAELRISQEAVEVLLKNKDSVEARLSHLMDVAGKMAGAIGNILNAESVSCEPFDEAQLALAEWDGIKEGGK